MHPGEGEERNNSVKTVQQRTGITPEPLLTPAEVAHMFRVDPKTVTRWAKKGKLSSIRTIGGHRRFREAEVRALLLGTDTRVAQDAEVGA